MSLFHLFICQLLMIHQSCKIIDNIKKQLMNCSGTCLQLTQNCQTCKIIQRRIQPNQIPSFKAGVFEDETFAENNQLFELLNQNQSYENIEGLSYSVINSSLKKREYLQEVRKNIPKYFGLNNRSKTRLMQTISNKYMKQMNIDLSVQQSLTESRVEIDLKNNANSQNNSFFPNEKNRKNKKIRKLKQKQMNNCFPQKRLSFKQSQKQYSSPTKNIVENQKNISFKNQEFYKGISNLSKSSTSIKVQKQFQSDPKNVFSQRWLCNGIDLLQNNHVKIQFQYQNQRLSMTVQLWSDNTIYNPKIRELRPPSPPKTPPKKPKGKNSNLYIHLRDQKLKFSSVKYIIFQQDYLK